MVIGIIGIDCATQPKNIGLACGFFENGEAQIDEVTIGSNHSELIGTIVEWINRFESTLIALDAPLGWPINLGHALYDHVAGNLIQVDPNLLFRRSTDRFVKSTIGKQPLDVGADRIARTAHAAVTLLDEIRIKTGKKIPLVWEPGLQTGIFAIEVYPAATLIAHDMNVDGYKRNDGQDARRELLNKLGNRIELPRNTSLMESNDDALDAALCVLAGADFIREEVFQPTDMELAKKEGWIWVKKP